MIVKLVTSDADVCHANDKRLHYVNETLYQTKPQHSLILWSLKIITGVFII